MHSDERLFGSEAAIGESHPYGNDTDVDSPIQHQKIPFGADMTQHKLDATPRGHGRFSPSSGAVCSKAESAGG